MRYSKNVIIAVILLTFLQQVAYAENWQSADCNGEKVDIESIEAKEKLPTSEPITIKVKEEVSTPGHVTSSRTDEVKVDFGPYMRELQRRIKMNWDPPKGNENKRIVLLIKIAKDGRLLSCNIFKSSGFPNADKAAINAVHDAALFRPLPSEFKGSSIDIQFTFDYNVFGASRY